MKKNIKKIIGIITCITLLCSMTGCAMLDSAINDLRGSLIGNGYTINTYDNYGNKVMTTTGDKINIEGNPVETASYDSYGDITDNTYIASIVNKYKNMFGKSRIVVVKSQLGQPITAYSGDEVYWEIPKDLPKMTKLMIDGKALYIHRANFQIIDKTLLN